MGIHMRAMVGTPESAVYLHPWSSVAHPLLQGVPLGIDLNTGEMLVIDPWMLKHKGIVNSLMAMVLGDKNAGKTTLCKILFLRLASLGAGYNERMRLRLNSAKNEQGETEYAELTDYFMSRPVVLRKHKLNIVDFDLFPEETELLDLLVNVYESALGRPLRDYEPLMMQAAVHKLTSEFREIASIELLNILLERQDVEDAARYLDATDSRLKQSMGRFFNEDTFPHLPADRTVRQDENARRNSMHQRLLGEMGRVRNYDARRMSRDSSTLAAAGRRLLHGDMGRMFGGNESLYPLLTESTATYDWSGLPDKAVTVGRSVFWKAQTAALVRGDMSIMPHLDADDEDHGNWRNLMYARMKAEYVKKSRAYPTMNLALTHRIADYETVGDAGSEQRERAVNMLRDIDMWFVGGQTSDRKSLRDVREHLGFSEPDAHALTQLGVGQFAMKLGHLKPIFFQLILTPSELGLVQTNRATAAMLNRMPLFDDPDVARRIGQSGVRFIGSND